MRGLVLSYLSFCFLFLFSTVNSLKLSSANVSAVEMSALYDIYAATNGPDWECCDSASIPWNFSVPNPNPCVDNWQGIYCRQSLDLFENHVYRLYLDDMNLTGTIPYSIGNLSHLTDIDFSFSYISTTIPDSLGNITGLTRANFDDNFLTGPIPDMSNLTFLEEVNMGSNNLTGTIPTYFGALSALSFLNLNQNCLHGSIPDELGNVISMVYMILSENDLTGTLPNSLGNLTNLESLSLYLNNLNGTIPSSYGAFGKLSQLSLGRNRFTSTIPTCLGNLSSIINFELSESFFTGELPIELGHMTNIISFNVGGNSHIIGSIPTFLGNFIYLESLYLYQSYFDGPLPSIIGNLSNLEFMELSDNSLTGELPESFSKLSSIQHISLSDNELTGTIPESFGDLSLLVQFAMATNSISGTLPSVWGQLSRLSYLYLFSNSLSGTIPAEVGSLPHLEHIDLSNNRFSGSIPTSFSNMSSLRHMLLEHNRLSGTLDGVFNASTHEHFDTIQLNNNEFTGTLPDTLFELDQLKTVVLSTNCLHGPLPSTICHGQNIVNMILDGLSSSANCRNTIFPGWSSSYIITVSVNGDLPKCLFELPKISILHLSGNGFNGDIPENIQIGESLMDLAISHNMLVGAIDESFQHGTWLKLDLSYNRLYGTLHSDFNEPTNGTSLYLQNNRLSGRIPSSLHNVQDISILGSNVFTCNIDGSNLPKNDDGKHNYQCGSTNFNLQYFVWLGLVVLVLGLVAISSYWNTAFEKYIGLDALSRYFDEWVGYTNPDCFFKTPLVDVGRLFSVLLQVTWYCTLVIVLLLMPVYLCLSPAYGSYTHDYAYTASATYLSGIVPFAVEFSLWTSILTLFLLLFYVFVRSRKNIELRFSTTQKNEGRSMDACQKAIIAAAFISVNMLVVVGANVSFLYVAIYGNSSYLLLEQVMLSFFKLMWNNFFSPMVLRMVLNVIAPVASKSRGFIVQFVNLQMLVAVLNNILIPLAVVMVIDPNCFYNVFVAAPAVTSKYTTEYCTISFDDGCFEMLQIPETTTYNPPFEYNYQCSSSLITYYSPTFVSLCSVSTFVIPLGKVLLVQLHKYANEDTLWFKVLDFGLPRILKPIPTEANVKLTNDIDLKDDSMADDESYFEANQSLIILCTYLGLLLTFGVVFPPLAVCFCLTIFVNIYCLKLELGRFVSAAISQNVVKLKELVEKDCEGMGSISIIQSIVWILISVSCLFYTMFLFDTLGDAVGFEKAFWVVIVFPLLPVLMSLAHSVCHAVFWSSCLADKVEYLEL